MINLEHHNVSPTKIFLDGLPTKSPDSFLLLGQKIHHPDAGLNPLVDAAAYLFTRLGQIKKIKWQRQLAPLHTDLLAAIRTFEQTSEQLGYSRKHIILARYILCSTFDDIFSASIWQRQWIRHSLVSSFHPETSEDTFFTILRRILKDPEHYIDVMEFTYLCLSMGYKGHFKDKLNGQLQLEQIRNQLYRHIRTYRGNTSKLLSPQPLKPYSPKPLSRRSWPMLFLCLVTASLIMAMFVSLGYLMDVINDEAYLRIATVKNIPSQPTEFKQTARV